jgi:hypothetical protein
MRKESILNQAVFEIADWFSRSFTVIARIDAVIQLISSGCVSAAAIARTKQFCRRAA